MSILTARAGRSGTCPPAAGSPERGHNVLDAEVVGGIVEDGVVADPGDLVLAVSANATPVAARTTEADTRATSHALREL